MQLNTIRQYKNCIRGVVYETTNTHHHNRCGLRFFFFFLILRGERENGTQHHTPVLKLHAAVQLSNVRITKKTWKKCSYFPLPFEYQKKKKSFYLTRVGLKCKLPHFYTIWNKKILYDILGVSLQMIRAQS